MVGIATVVISTNVDRILVILVAQVFNGCLLPIFSVCLLLCVNDEQFMLSAPQKGWSNVFLVTSVTFTMFLAGNVLVEKTLSWLLAAWLGEGSSLSVQLLAWGELFYTHSIL